jgi:hypothetical protein
LFRLSLQYPRRPLATYCRGIVEERFVYTKPPIGKARGAVILDGDIRIEYPLLKAPVTIPFDSVLAAVRITEVGGEQPILRRDVRLLQLSPALTEPNVVIVFESPVHIERFKFGAEKGLAISARERKRGLDLDGLGVSVERPDGLVTSLGARGVRSLPTVAMAMSELVGEATGVDAVERRHKLRTRRLRARLTVLGFGVGWTTLIAARLAVGRNPENVPAATVVGLIASSLAWAALTALAVSSAAAGGGARPVRDRVRGSRALGYLAAVVALFAVPLVVAGWMASHLGTPRVLAYGLVAGVPCGVICGVGLRATRPPPGV